MKQNIRKWQTWSRLALGMVLLGLLVFGLPGSVWAADFRGGDNVVIAEDEVINDDLFVTGRRVEVNGPVKGDLFAIGEEVIVNGKVEGSVFLSARTLTINGQVNGSVYGGAYAMTIGRGVKIGRNLYFGGFSLKTEQNSMIEHSLYGSSYQLILNGKVAHDVQANSAALEVNGAVGGDVKGEVSAAGQVSPPPFMPNYPWIVPMAAPGLRVGEEAKIGGKVGVKVIEEEKVDIKTSVSRYLQNALRQGAGEFMALLIVGGLLLWLWPGLAQRVGAAAQEKLLSNAGWGCLITALFPLAVVLAAVALVALTWLGGLVTFGRLTGDIASLGGVSLGVIVVVFVFVAFTVTKAIAAFLGGRLILTRTVLKTKSGWLMDFMALALGALVYEVLRAIPILGWLLAIVVILVGLGAMYGVIRGSRRPTPPPQESPPMATETTG